MPFDYPPEPCKHWAQKTLGTKQYLAGEGQEKCFLNKLIKNRVSECHKTALDIRWYDYVIHELKTVYAYNKEDSIFQYVFSLIMPEEVTTW